jgi:hypothetical protein
MVVTYTVSGELLQSDTPRVWSDKIIAGLTGLNRNYDVAPDGKRVAALMLPETTSA